MKHLTAATMKRPIFGRIKEVAFEAIDGRVQPVLYFYGRKRGLIISRIDYEQMYPVLGRHKGIEHVLAMN